MKFSKKGKRWFGASGAVLLVMIVGAYFALSSFEPRLRAEMLRILEERFNGTAELESVHLSWFPKVRANGKKLVLWYRGRKDLPPLISIEEFSVETGWRGLLRSPADINLVTLRGLVINIPPDEEKNGSTGKRDWQKAMNPGDRKKSGFSFVIETVRADESVLNILPKKIDREPLVFELHKLTLHSVGFGHPMQYAATLKNAKPPGLIDAKGGFGPWQKMNPGHTPVSGKYTFQNADLSVFKGISGRLSSVGQFKGVLQNIEVTGTTDTPDFTVRVGNQPVDLKTEFHAVVDGTNGDTLLQPVTAQFGKTTVICQGGIVKMEGKKGKTIVLDVHVDEGRIEDLMKLVIHSKPPLTGTIRFTARLELPPGDQDVVEKLKLKGIFDVGSAEFTTVAVQDKIEKFSLQSRGRHEDSTEERIVSKMQGHFTLQDATTSFSGLSFIVPGAQVRLDGDYRLVSEQLDFRGNLLMQAKLSQTQKGMRSVLLKMVDPFFKKGKSGAVLPIKITGTLKEPSYGLNFGGSGRKD
jgi:hypothetical protein